MDVQVGELAAVLRRDASEICWFEVVSDASCIVCAFQPSCVSFAMLFRVDRAAAVPSARDRNADAQNQAHAQTQTVTEAIPPPMEIRWACAVPASASRASIRLVSQSFILFAGKEFDDPFLLLIDYHCGSMCGSFVLPFAPEFAALRGNCVVCVALPRIFVMHVEAPEGTLEITDGYSLADVPCSVVFDRFVCVQASSLPVVRNVSRVLLHASLRYLLMVSAQRVVHVLDLGAPPAAARIAEFAALANAEIENIEDVAETSVCIRSVDRIGNAQSVLWDFVADSHQKGPFVHPTSQSTALTWLCSVWSKSSAGVWMMDQFWPSLHSQWLQDVAAQNDVFKMSFLEFLFALTGLLGSLSVDPTRLSQQPCSSASLSLLFRSLQLTSVQTGNGILDYPKLLTICSDLPFGVPLFSVVFCVHISKTTWIDRHLILSKLVNSCLAPADVNFADALSALDVIRSANDQCMELTRCLRIISTHVFSFRFLRAMVDEELFAIGDLSMIAAQDAVFLSTERVVSAFMRFQDVQDAYAYMSARNVDMSVLARHCVSSSLLAKAAELPMSEDELSSFSKGLAAIHPQLLCPFLLIRKDFELFLSASNRVSQAGVPSYLQSAIGRSFSPSDPIIADELFSYRDSPGKIVGGTSPGMHFPSAHAGRSPMAGRPTPASSLQGIPRDGDRFPNIFSELSNAVSPQVLSASRTASPGPITGPITVPSASSSPRPNLPLTVKESTPVRAAINSPLSSREFRVATSPLHAVGSPAVEPANLPANTSSWFARMTSASNLSRLASPPQSLVDIRSSLLPASSAVRLLPVSPKSPEASRFDNAASQHRSPVSHAADGHERSFAAVSPLSNASPLPGSLVRSPVPRVAPSFDSPGLNLMSPDLNRRQSPVGSHLQQEKPRSRYSLAPEPGSATNPRYMTRLQAKKLHN
eukprot:ANDGO_05762.mRNA.1 hypothetical protein